MNLQIQNFLNELKLRKGVVGVILFGSWARGNNRPKSDVDLVIIIENGYQRCVEKKDGQIFEIIYTTEKGALDYWMNHKDDAYGLWSVAKILLDREGRIEKLKKQIMEVLNVEKEEINELQLGQFEFDAVDLIDYIEDIYKEDEVTAKFLLSNKIFALTEMFFNVRRMWVPAPKQRLEKIKRLQPDLYNLIRDFYSSEKDFTELIEISKEIIKIVFKIG